MKLSSLKFGESFFQKKPHYKSVKEAFKALHDVLTKSLVFKILNFFGEVSKNNLD